MPIILAQAAPPAAVAPAPPKPSVITNADWLRKPTGEDFADVYPKSAAARNIEGRAVIHCRVNELGALVECKVTAEDPVGEGFGDAAIAMSAKFKMRPQTRDGAPVGGGQINIPIVFKLPQAAGPSPEVTLRCYGYAAAEAERHPTATQAQIAAFEFGLIIQVRLFPEHPKPSELAEVLASQRSIADPKLDDPNFKSERDECAVVAASRAGVTMERLVGALQH